MPLPPPTSGDDVIDNSGSNVSTTFSGKGGDDILIAGSGGDNISGNAGDDEITGGTGNDTLSGGSGDDVINGGSGNDVITGGSGDDVITGGAGNDVLTGGAGDDTFIFEAGNFGTDTVNIRVNDNDVIDLTALGITENDVTFTKLDNNTVLISGIPGGGTIVVNANGKISIDDVKNLTQFCFLEGTMIRTQDGDRAIESLVAGTPVVLADGSVKPLKWLAKQTIVRRFAKGDRRTPVRIGRGALGENLPARDLIVSPNHAVLIDGVLVQAGALLNGLSITEMTDAPDTFVYYNLEFDNHELVIAEGVACESFLDSVSRDVFDNAAEYAVLFPNASEMTEIDLPRAKSARQVPAAVLKTIKARAAAMAQEEVAA